MILRKINTKTGKKVGRPIVIKKKVAKKKKSALQKRKDDCKSKLWLTKADKLWSICIHLKHAHTCAVDKDCSGNLEAHHLITRSHRNTRHEITNGILLCSLHHKYSTELSPHAGPVGFGVWMEKNRPEQWDWVICNRWRRNQALDFKSAYQNLKNIKELLELL